MKNITKIAIAVLFIGIVAFVFIGIPYYNSNYKANVKEDAVIYIPTNSTYEKVKTIVSPYLEDLTYFDRVSKSQKYPQKVKAGRYKIHKGENNKQVVRRLLLGQQEPVHLRVKSYDDIYELAEDLGNNLEQDSLEFINYFTKVALEKGFSEVEELKIYFTPETYFLDWNTSPKQIFDKFEKIHTQFWNKERTEKAEKLGLTKLEIYTLASIVQREFMKKDEVSIIASLYLNRVHKGMKLQSDPTVIYAERKAQGFKVMMKRVKNVSIDSPYNTYKYKGLPPLPICIPNDFVVDAVLNPASTNYLFMCANPNDRGRHLFTASDVEHMKNARAYRDWLDAQGIR